MHGLLHPTAIRELRLEAGSVMLRHKKEREERRKRRAKNCLIQEEIEEKLYGNDCLV